GNYPGRARNADELRRDLEEVLSLVPGVHRVNVHAIYAETGGKKVDRDALEPKHFAGWIAWARKRGIGLDFNPTFFAHPKAADGLTLSHPDPGIRAFWIAHGVACRRIGEAMARELGTPCGVNLWIPDGSKDLPADRWGPRRRLVESLDAIYADALGIDRRLCLDSVESKLFGLGSEAYVVGSHEFYLAYALARGLAVCLDMGHFHPTEAVHDKLSAVLAFADWLLLHVSRPVRWDSDHAVLFDDDVRAVFQELVRGEALGRVKVALDYFDASINRIAAYTIGARATRKAILYALLDPSDRLKALEAEGNGAGKLALMEEMKTMPFGAVWDMLCLRAGAPVGAAWIPQVERYERDVLARRA
ncbi:MAG TPA: L-rhamnose isomerase, partial [Phycisphaerae bacterium]|nr:L-rhamnose isomerase [Phycisphaerae bacterium]